MGYNAPMTADLFSESEEQTMAGDKREKDVPAASGDSAEAPTGFEEDFARLEQVIEEMERGELPLEELLTRFEEGVNLVKNCRRFLKQAQARIERFVEVKDGQWVLKELDD